MEWIPPPTCSPTHYDFAAQRGRHGCRLQNLRWETCRSARSLLGKPNLYNIGAAIGAAIGLGLPAEVIRAGIASMPGVPGRFESVNAGQNFRVIVDFAHTDDALARVLQSAREITPGRLIVRVRVRRRPRPDEAAADGRSRRQGERLRGCDVPTILAAKIRWPSLMRLKSGLAAPEVSKERTIRWLRIAEKPSGMH